MVIGGKSADSGNMWKQNMGSFLKHIPGTTHEQHMNNTTTVSKTLQWLVENNLVMKFSTSRIPNTFGPSESESLIFSKS
jgi:hypothetical protein